MEIKIFKNFFKKIFNNLFKNRREIKLGFYGPPNAGKTSLANRNMQGLYRTRDRNCK
jgi:GTPase SAR1 family protein